MLLYYDWLIETFDIILHISIQKGESRSQEFVTILFQKSLFKDLLDFLSPPINLNHLL